MRLLFWIQLFCMKNNLIFTSEQWQDHYLHQGLICAILKVFPQNLVFEIWSKLTFFIIFRCQIQQGKLQHESVTCYPTLVLFQAGRRVKVGGQDSCAPAYSHSAVPIAAASRNRQKPTDPTTNCRLQNQPLRLARRLRQGSLETRGLCLQRFWVPCTHLSSARERATARKTILPNRELTELFYSNIKHLKKAVSAEFITLTLQPTSAQLLYPTVGSRRH